MRRLQTGDSVIVISGSHKGRQGKVKKLSKDQQRVVIEGVNMVKRHTRSTPERPGGIIPQEAPIAASNVMPLDPQTGKPTRVSHRVEDGKKVRVAKSGATITSARTAS